MRSSDEEGAEEFWVDRSNEFLDYCYPMDLWAMIAAEWRLFEPRLRHDRKYWNDRFTHLAKIRTPSAHNRDASLPPHEVRLAEAYCKEILALLSEEQSVQLATRS